MGLLVNGEWRDQWYDTEGSGGRFIREESRFRDVVTADGSSGFSAEPGRYHLYVSLACPWAHRTLIVRRLKQLEQVISLSVVDPLMGEHGWVFSGAPGAIPDTVNGAARLYEIDLQPPIRRGPGRYRACEIQNHRMKGCASGPFTGRGITIERSGAYRDYYRSCRFKEGRKIPGKCDLYRGYAPALRGGRWVHCRIFEGRITQDGRGGSSCKTFGWSGTIIMKK